LFSIHAGEAGDLGQKDSGLQRSIWQKKSGFSRAGSVSS